jgi:uncharacterized repeat protein (TIGR01451 family)
MGERRVWVRFGWMRRGAHAAGRQSTSGGSRQRRVRVVVAAGALLAPLLVLALPTAASAAGTQVLYVSTAGSNSGSCTSTGAGACITIEQAVTLAESTYSSDSVTIDVAAGSYTGSDEAVSISVSQPLSIDGAGASSTTLDDDGSGSDVTVAGNSQVTIEGLTINGGSAENGGGVMTTGAGTDLTLQDDVVSHNSADFGGAGVDDNGPMTLTDDTISDNSAFQGGGIEVGGPYGNGVVTTFTDDTISDNSAFYGAGLHNNGGASVVDDSTFFGNAGGIGGAVKNDGPIDTLDLTNDTISDNSASQEGAGLFTAYAGVATLVDDTFTGNSAPYGRGAGFYFLDNSGTGTGTQISNTLFANNNGGDCGGLVEGAAVDGGYNITDDPTCFGSTSPTSKGTIESTDDALWGLGGTPPALAANGSSGPDTIAITPYSSAFQLVPKAACTVATDERGQPRPGVPGENCDSGAFEVRAVTTTTSTVVEAAGQPWSSGYHFDGSTADDTATVTAADHHPVPGGTVTYSFFANSDCSNSSGELSTQTVDVAPDGSVPGSATTAALSPGDYSFDATYLGDGPDEGSSSSCEPFEVVFASVHVDKTVSSPYPDFGSDDTFTLTATNGSDATAASGQVVVVDDLPAGLDYVSSSASDGAVSVSGSKVSWTIPDLDAGASAHEEIVVKVDRTSTVTNTATFTQANPTQDSGTTGSSNTVTVTPVEAVLSIDETVADAAPTTGSNDQFTAEVTNSGPDTAHDVAVTDPLPGGVSLVSEQVSVGSVTEGQVDGVETLEWDVGTLAVGSSATLEVTVEVKATSGSLSNPVTATDSTYDPSGQTKTATASLAVAAAGVVPSTHTGEPWAAALYWLLVGLIGIVGLAALELGRRRRLAQHR